MLVESRPTSNTVTYRGPKLPSTWLTTSLEYKNISTSSAPNFWAALSTAISASYSNLLLEAWKPNLSNFSSLIALLSSLKALPLFQQLKERPSPIYRSRNKLIHGNNHPSDPLYFHRATGWVKLLNCLDLAEVNLDSSVRYHVPQEQTRPHTKCTFACIKAQLVSSQYLNKIQLDSSHALHSSCF